MKYNPTPFLEDLFFQIENNNINLQNWPIDHICYRTSSDQNYEEIKKDFQKLGECLVESEVNGRLIATYKLFEPIKFNQYTIALVEVPAPKKNKTTIEGFEHVEFVIDISFEELMSHYPNINFVKTGLNKKINPELEIEFDQCAIKFHHQSLEEVIQLEKTLQNL